LLDDGRASSIEVEAVAKDMDDASKALALHITVVDAAGQQVVFVHHVPVA